MTTTYTVLFLDLLQNDVTVLKVFSTHSEALSYMYKIVHNRKEIESDMWFKKVSDNENVISVFELGYFTKKRLICKYMIREYEDLQDCIEWESRDDENY